VREAPARRPPSAVVVGPAARREAPARRAPGAAVVGPAARREAPARRAPRAAVIGPGARREAPARRALRAVVIGPAARRALREGARGAVELAFGPGGYVRLAEHRVLLAPARSPLGPLSILVAGLARGDLAPGEPAGVSAGALVVGALRIELDGAGEAPPPGRRELAPHWRGALGAALEVVPPAPAALTDGLEALASGDLPTALARLAGRGDGLTPAGDDALAGYAAWRWAQGDPVALPAHRCAPLGRDYLRCAERGELARPAAGVLEAIRAGEPRRAARRARALAGWGATSGAAMLWGMAAGAARTVALDERRRTEEP
jgi:hypothetical protein